LLTLMFLAYLQGIETITAVEDVAIETEVSSLPTRD